MANTAPIIPVVDQAQILNSLAKQSLGSSVIVQDDLSNIADFGKAFEDLDSATQQIVTEAMITLVTEQIVVNRAYTGIAPDIIRSRETSGYDTSKGIIQKLRANLPTAMSDADVYDPAPGSSSDPFVNHAIDIEASYFSKPISARYEWSVPERWLTGAFLSRDSFAATIAAVGQQVRNAIQLNVDGVSFAQIRGSIGLNLAGVDAAVGGPRAFNLLAEYNAGPGVAAPVTFANALSSPEFLRYATHRIYVVLDYMKSYSTLYNEKHYPNFVDNDSLQLVMHSQFRRSAQQFMLSDVYNEEYLQLPHADTVVSWKAMIETGNDIPSFDTTSRIFDKFEMSTIGYPSLQIDQNGVIAHAFHTGRIGIYNLSTRTTSMPDPVGLKTNFFTHVFGRGMIDPYEPGVTFYIADE